MPSRPAALRLVEYVRVSKLGERDPDSESFQTVKEQRRANGHAVGLRPGAKIVRSIEDLDQSGGTMDRAGLREALAMIYSGQADGIVVAKLDRFARTSLGIDEIDRLESAGKVFISAADNFDTSTPVGRFALGMMMLVAKLERERHIENWKASTRNAIERGVHTVVPFGYQRENGPGSKLVPSSPEALVVRRIFAERADGAGIAAIADSLNADCEPAPHSPQWTRQSVRALITSRTYLGEARYGENIRLNAHDALVDPVTWADAQTERRPSRRNGGSLLAGLVRCAGCGYVMGAGGSSGHRRYNCNRNHATGRCPSPTTAPAGRLELLVEERFLERYGDAATAGGSGENAEVRAATVELGRAEREYMAWRDDTELREALGDEEYRAGLIVRKARVDTAREAHEDAVRCAGAEGLAVDAAVWGDLSLPERRQLLRVGVDAVALRRADSTHTPLPERVDIFWAGEAPDDLVRSRRGVA